MSVGTTQGTSYFNRGREGQGEAFILSGNRNGKRALGYFDQEARKRLKGSDKSSTPKLELDDIWYRHEDELQADLDKITDWSVELMGADVRDPFTSPQGRDLQKFASNFQRKSDYSKQLKELYKIGRGKIDADPKKYSTDSVVAYENWFRRPLSDIIKSGDGPPPLLKADPVYSTSVLDAELIKGIKEGGSIPMDALAKDKDKQKSFAKQSLYDPKYGETYQEDILSILAYMEDEYPEALDELEKTARLEKLSVPEYIRWTQLQPRFGAKAYDIEAFMDKIPVKISENTVEDIDDALGRDVTTSRTNIVEKPTKNNIRKHFKLHPEGLFELMAQAGVENEEEATEYVYEYLRDKTRSTFKKTLSAEKTSGKWWSGYGSNEDEVEWNFDKWKQDFLAGNPEAVGYVEKIKLEDGSRIVGGDLIYESIPPSQPVEGMEGVNYPIGVQPVGVDFETTHGLRGTGEDAKEVKSNYEVSIQEGEYTDEQLAKFYMRALQDGKGKLYGEAQGDPSKFEKGKKKKKTYDHLFEEPKQEKKKGRYDDLFD